jgi:exoribonuclease R
MYQVREANQMVEEFMLAANMSVAGKILKEFPSCSLLRCVNSSSLDFEFAGPETFFIIALYVRAL